MNYIPMKIFLRAIVVVYFLFARILLANTPTYVSVGVFQQEQRIFYNVDDGLPSNDIRDIAATEDGTVLRLQPKDWRCSLVMNGPL